MIIIVMIIFTMVMILRNYFFNRGFFIHKNSVSKENMLGDFKLYQTKLFYELSASSVSDCLVLVHCVSGPGCFLTEIARNKKKPPNVSPQCAA